MEKPFIRIENLSFTYQDESVLNVIKNLSTDVYSNKFVSVVGPSGCGKSTLLKLLAGLETNYEGKIIIDNKTPVDLLENRKIGFIFQNPALLLWKKAKENIKLPRKIMGLKQENSNYLFKLVGLEKFGDYLPHQLSGGMQQRVSLARALSYHPTLLLMDEPFGALDELHRFKMNKELYRIWKQAKEIRNIIFVTHSIEEAVLLSDTILVLSKIPSSVIKSIDLKLDREDLAKTRTTGEYFGYVNKIREIINE